MSNATSFEVRQMSEEDEFERLVILFSDSVVTPQNEGLYPIVPISYSHNCKSLHFFILLKDEIRQ